MIEQPRPPIRRGYLKRERARTRVRGIEPKRWVSVQQMADAGLLNNIWKGRPSD